METGCLTTLLIVATRLWTTVTRCWWGIEASCTCGCVPPREEVPFGVIDLSSSEAEDDDAIDEGDSDSKWTPFPGGPPS